MSAPKGNMTVWPEIACQRGHKEHGTRHVHVELGGPTAYHDLAPIPRRLARSFEMLIWEPSAYPVDGGPYCPAHDAVSETIATHRIWEPRETALTLAVCSSAEPGQVMVDFGAQVGWFSMLAMSCGITAMAVEADRANIEILNASARLNGWGPEITYIDDIAQMKPDHLETFHERIGPETHVWGNALRVRLAKIDIEGAEDQAVRVLWPSIAAGLVDHMLIEISPVFADYYPDLVASLLDAGYDGYLLPPKAQPAYRLSVLPDDLEPWKLDPATAREDVAGYYQENVWFSRQGAAW